MADYYETLAAGYDWIFDDDALDHGLAINHPATARLLQRTSDASAVLDAACGIVQLADSAVTRHGRRCIVLYAWEIPDRLDQEHVAHIVLIFEDGSRIEPREYRIGFHPFTLGDLRERLEAAGLKEVDTDFDDARDRYAITAVPA